MAQPPGGWFRASSSLPLPTQCPAHCPALLPGPSPPPVAWLPHSPRGDRSLLATVSEEEKAGWCGLAPLSFGLEGTCIPSALSPLAELVKDLPHCRGTGKQEEVDFRMVVSTWLCHGFPFWLLAIPALLLFHTYYIVTPSLGGITPSPCPSRY